MEARYLNWFVYIIQNQRGILYTGITNDPPRRLTQHNGGPGGAKATRAGRPWSFVYLETSLTKMSAMRREYEIKQLPRAKKLLILQAHDLVEQALSRQGERGNVPRHVVEAH